MRKYYDEDVDFELKSNKLACVKHVKVRLSEFWQCDECSGRAFGPIALREIDRARGLFEKAAKGDQKEDTTESDSECH